MKYTIEISESAEKSLKKIPKKERLKILEKIDFLTEDPMPSGSVKLQGKAFHRIRSGDYRIIYLIQKSILVVLVVDIGHRKEIYL